MCHIIDRDDQLRIIEDAKRDFGRVYAVIERNRENVDELIQLIGVMNDTLALLLDISNDGERSVVDRARYKYGMSDRALAKRFGLTSANRLVAC